MNFPLLLQNSIRCPVTEAYLNLGNFPSKLTLEASVAQRAPKIPLPTDWPSHVRTGILHAIALAQVALTAARARASKKLGVVAGLRAKVEEQAEEISRLEEERRSWAKSLSTGTNRRRRCTSSSTAALVQRMFVFSVISPISYETITYCP